MHKDLEAPNHETPAWLDRRLYPFASRFINVPDGRMHYVDEGQGEPIVFIHGVPSWSFNYRHLIRGLSSSFRCVAMDHLGFGLSDKPVLSTAVPQTLAGNVKRFIHNLDLRDVTLVVHDWGGPIGLAYALEEPRNVRRLVMFNTWLWGANVDLRTSVVTRLLASPVYRLLEDRLNFTARMFIPQVMADRRVLTKEVHGHYTEPLRHRDERRIQWELVRGVLHETSWIEGLWAKREALRSIPTLILWGMKDKAFSVRDLARWKHALPHAIVHEVGEAGHFPQEEAPAAVLGHLDAFFESTGGGMPKANKGTVDDR